MRFQTKKEMKNFLDATATWFEQTKDGDPTGPAIKTYWGGQQVDLWEKKYTKDVAKHMSEIKFLNIMLEDHIATIMRCAPPNKFVI